MLMTMKFGLAGLGSSAARRSAGEHRKSPARARRLQCTCTGEAMRGVLYFFGMVFDLGGRSRDASSVKSASCFVQIAASSRTLSARSLARFLDSDRSELRS